MPVAKRHPGISLRVILRKGIAFGPGKAELLEHIRLRQTAGNDSLRLVQEVTDCKIERAADPDYAILSFTTPDLPGIAFAVRDDALTRMAELLSDYHIEAFPEGLHLH